METCLIASMLEFLEIQFSILNFYELLRGNQSLIISLCKIYYSYGKKVSTNKVGPIAAYSCQVELTLKHPAQISHS